MTTLRFRAPLAGHDEILETPPQVEPLRLEDWLRLGRALRSRFVLRQCVELGLAPFVTGTVWIHDDGAVRIGDRVRLDARSAPIELHSLPGAEIRIGHDVHIEGGVSIEAHRSVVIENGVHIEGYCKIIDNNFHMVKGDRHRRPESSPVFIEAEALIGRRSVVLPGVHILKGTIVSTASVVRRPTSTSTAAAQTPSGPVRRPDHGPA